MHSVLEITHNTQLVDVNLNHAKHLPVSLAGHQQVSQPSVHIFHETNLNLRTVTQKAHARGAKTPWRQLYRSASRTRRPPYAEMCVRCVNSSAILYEIISKNEIAANPFFVFDTNTKRRQVLTECV